MDTEPIKKGEPFVYGWVPSNVNGNFEAIAVWLQYGEESDADKFYAETNAQAVGMGLTWFFQEVKPCPVRN